MMVGAGIANDNGSIESFNNRLCDERFNRNRWPTLLEARWSVGLQRRPQPPTPAFDTELLHRGRVLCRMYPPDSPRGPRDRLIECIGTYNYRHHGTHPVAEFISRSPDTPCASTGSFAAA